MKISIYSSAFNLINNGFFGWKDSILKSCEFADEVVIAVNKSKDNTLEELLDLKCNNLQIISCDISYSDPLLDGKLKNEALQKCSGDILIQLDLDEYIPISQKENWVNLAQTLLSYENVKSVMIPSINLYGSWEKYKDITPKWYMHKRGLFRGPVNFARNADGTVDTNRSDTCELIDADGNLVYSVMIPYNIENLRQDNIFVVHYGYLNFNARIKRNKEFWSEHWLKESGGKNPPHKIHTELFDFNDTTYQHNLSI